MSEVSISFSFNASILPQFVRDRFLVIGFFTFVRLSCGDDADNFGSFCKHDRHKPSTNEAETNCSGFTVVFSNIRSDQHQARKYFLYVQKINAVLGDVRYSFGFIPFESHSKSVHTICMYVKGPARMAPDPCLFNVRRIVYLGEVS